MGHVRHADASAPQNCKILFHSQRISKTQAVALAIATACDGQRYRMCWATLPHVLGNATACFWGRNARRHASQWLSSTYASRCKSVPATRPPRGAPSEAVKICAESSSLVKRNAEVRRWPFLDRFRTSSVSAASLPLPPLHHSAQVGPPDVGCKDADEQRVDAQAQP